MEFNKNKIFKSLSYVPFGKFILKQSYKRAIKQLNKLLIDHENLLHDIVLISNMRSSDFIYGVSDLNICFVTKDHCHPKKVLKELRGEIRKLSPLNMFINHNVLPIFTETEFKSSKVRSILATKEENKSVNWKSIKSNEVKKLNIGSQGLYSSQYFLLKRFERIFSRVHEHPYSRNFLRLYGKNTNQMISQFIRNGLLKNVKDSSWESMGAKLYGFNILATFYFVSFKMKTWEIIDQDRISYSSIQQDFEKYPQGLIDLTKQLLLNNNIEDIFFTPALLQLKEDEVRGKIFVDVVIRGANASLNHSSLNKIRKTIDVFMNENNTRPETPSISFQLTSMTLVKLKFEKSLFSYPLEGFFRKDKSFSARGRSYPFTTNARSVERGIIHFLLVQFMRFRSEHIRSGLIGSQFIKSLNLMIRYQMLDEYLVNNNNVSIPKTYSQMLERVSPQLKHLKPNDVVSEQDWKIIKLQLLYFLKRIRSNVSIKNPELKSLIF